MPKSAARITQNPRASAAGTTALTLGTAAAGALGLPPGVWIGVGVLAVVFAVWTLFLWVKGEESETPGGAVAIGGSQAAQGTGGSVMQAGGDINIGLAPSAHEPSGPSRAERLRLIGDEIRHLHRRFAQLEKQRGEWSSIWPGSHAAYQRLPAEKWNTYGASLNLPDEQHDVVQEAYELANDFNHEMERGPIAFGDAEPDLDALRDAFTDAQRVIAAASGKSVAAQPNPFEAARHMQQQWHSEELGAGLLSIRQELVVNQRRLKRMLSSGSSKEFRGFPSARWTTHEDLVRRKAPSVCILADQAYGLIMELRDAGIEEQQRTLTDAEAELGREALALFEQTIAAIDKGIQP